MFETVPLVELGTEDEATNTVGGTMPTPVLPETKNYATDEKTKREILDGLLPILTWTRSDRAQLEDEWRSILRMELMKHDTGRRYYGRSDSYMPVYSRILATLVSSLSRGLFPSDEYMDVTARGDGDPESARPVKQYLQWEFESVGKVRQNIKPFLRQLANFGNSIIKYRYKKEIASRGKISNVSRLMGGGFAGERGFKPCTSYEGLSVSARSMFYTYIYPTTAESLADAQVIFEDIDVPRAYIEQMGRSKKWVNIADALNAPPNPEHDNNQAQHLSDSIGAKSPSDRFGLTAGDIKTITEVWTFLRLPPSAYLPWENKEAPLPVRIVMAGNVVFEVTRNPHFHQQPPYLLSRLNVSPGLIYGHGHGRAVRPLQYLANDFTNQTNDCGIMGLNPVVKMNPGLMVGPLRPFAPGVVWPMTDVQNGVQFDRPPIEQVQYGLQMLGYTIGMAQDGGGAPPVLQGTGGGRAGKTATGMQILQRNAMAPLQDVVEDIELDMLIPLMHGTWMNAQQFRQKDIMTTVSGSPMSISPEQLAGDWDFRWLASSQAVNQQMRAQQAMQLLQAVMPIAPILMQQGYIVDPVALIKRVYSDGFGFRGFDTFIRRAQAAPGAMPGQMIDPSQMQGVQGEQGDRVRSALEQITGMGGGGDMVPGEGEDFMQVRQEADQMAAQAGGVNGYGFE